MPDSSEIQSLKPQYLDSLPLKFQSKKVIVFIPARNEEASIGKIIDEVQRLYPRDSTVEKGFYIEILVTDDGSSDKTLEVATAKGVAVESLSKNLGLGGSTRISMKRAYELGADIAVKLDADFQHPPQDIIKVLEPILTDEADICYGSRFAGKIHYRMPLVRLLGNYFFTFIINALTDYKVSDAQTGLCAFNRKYLSIFKIPGNYNSAQQILIDANHKNMRYAEVPVDFYQRKTGKSFINFKYPFYVCTNMFRVLVYANPLKVFSMIGFALILFSGVYAVLSFFNVQNNWEILFFGVERLSLLALITGTNCFFFGILADLVIHRES